jgi:hypothetical protein
VSDYSSAFTTGDYIQTIQTVPGTYLGGTFIGATETLVAKGKIVVDVNWSVSVNVKSTFTKPQIESIDFVETTWEKV